MSESTRILWSGLTGRVGREAVVQAGAAGVAIVAGISRFDYDGTQLKIMSKHFYPEDGESNMELIDYGHDKKWYLYDNIANPLKEHPRAEDFDVIVDFSHPDVFDKVVELAVRTEKPLISGTSGLSDRQMARLYDAANHIPIFRGGNFRFKVKKFIDEAVELAKREEGRLDLYEDFYKGKSLPSETSKVIQRRISEATDRTVEVHSSDTFAEGNLICDWELKVTQSMPLPSFGSVKFVTHMLTVGLGPRQKSVHCRTIGFDELAHDVLEIAKVMKNKPIRKAEFYSDFYDLDAIWGDIPESAKTTL